MRGRAALAATLSAILALLSCPPQAWAALATTTPAPMAPVVPVAPLGAFAVRSAPISLAAPGLSLPSLAAPTLPDVKPRAKTAARAVAAPAIVAAAPAAAAAAVPSAKAEPLPTRLEKLTAAAAKDLAAVPAASPSNAQGTAERGFNRLIGLEVSGRSASDAADPVPAAPGSAQTLLSRPSRTASAAAEPAAPAAPAPTKHEVRTYLAGTAIFKIGVEALGLAVPLIALTVFGQAKWAAAMAMGWGLSQIIGSSIGGGLLDRKPPAKVLSRAMALQAVTVGAMIALFVTQSMTGLPVAQPVVILLLHAATGVLSGVADTARQVIPPLLVGADGQDLKVFNAKVHVAYETAGVVGALLTGVLIKTVGLVPALLLHPPAYLLAAWIFSRLHVAPAAAPFAEPSNSLKTAARRAWEDLKAGLRAVKGSRIVFWAAVALVLPLVLHKVLEGLLIPIAAKTLLGDPSVAAWIIGASNFGELLGAFFLMKANMSDEAAAKLRSPFWVRLMSMGVLGLWCFSLAPHLWILLPWVCFGSLSWAASDLSLRSKIQEVLPAELRGRAFGFLSAAAFGIVLLASLSLGGLFDAFAAGPVFLGVNAVLTVMVAGMLYAAHRLAKTYGPKI